MWDDQALGMLLGTHADVSGEARDAEHWDSEDGQGHVLMQAPAPCPGITALREAELSGRHRPSCAAACSACSSVYFSKVPLTDLTEAQSSVSSNTLHFLHVLPHVD